jgi:glucokinase
MARIAASILVADIGGTNARFALFERGRFTCVTDLPVADFGGPVEAMRSFLAGAAQGHRPSRAALAAAGPLRNGKVVMTNVHWTVDAKAIARALGSRDVRVVNDFAALAWSLPALPKSALRRIGKGASVAGAPLAVIGPGTGFGVAALIREKGKEAALVTEGGHATLPAANRREDAIIEALRKRVGHVSVERALSGEGLEHLYRAVAIVDRRKAPKRDAAGIVAHALAGDCVSSRRTLELFCALLGGVAGNIALTFGARGGVFIGGGIVPRFDRFLVRSQFRARFEAKGRFSGYLAAIPTSVILHPHAAFLGLVRLLRTSPPSR